jgi:hypothetical protein
MSKSPKHPPTPEQQAIIDAAVSETLPLMVKAYAGCAKTTTLEFIAHSMSVRPSLALAFNVRIKKELEARFPGHFKVLTMNGLGHSAFGKALGKRCAVEADKTLTIMKEVVKREAIDTDQDSFVLALQLVRRARMLGLVPNGTPGRGLVEDTEAGWQLVADSIYADPTEMMVYVARLVLKESIRQAYTGVIDFDDQIYMSTLFGGVFPRFPRVVVDEAQDLSPLNHIMVQKSSAGWLGVVGDPKQAIYAFRGADSQSMSSLRELRPAWIDLPLHTTFRCPKKIVERQSSHAPGFLAAPLAPEGEIEDWMEKDTWNLPDGEMAILCRNNAPLFAMALRIIKRGIGCTLMGGEIGKGLISHAKKLLPNPDTPADVCEQVISDWMDAEISKARANEKEELVAIIRDKGECLLAVIENGAVRCAGDIAKVLNSMFSKESLRITLATGHKAKGLEWDTVIHLDPWRVPSKYAIRALSEGNRAPLEQDMHLRYVIETRVKRRLILANLEGFL